MLKQLKSPSVFLRSHGMAVGATLEGVHLPVLRNTKFGVVLQDGAAQTREVEIFLSQGNCQDWIRAGDYNQLPPTAQNEFAKDKQMETSLFERLIVQLGLGAEFLDTQYRMHPELAAFPSRSFYDGEFKSGTLSSGCPTGFPWPTVRPLAIIDVPGRGSGSTSSNSNEAQLDATQDIVKGFLAGGFVLKDIASLCTYKDQVALYEKETRVDA